MDQGPRMDLMHGSGHDGRGGPRGMDHGGRQQFPDPEPRGRDPRSRDPRDPRGGGGMSRGDPRGDRSGVT